jgi:hypothetical protein
MRRWREVAEEVRSKKIEIKVDEFGRANGISQDLQNCIWRETVEKMHRFALPISGMRLNFNLACCQSPFLRCHSFELVVQGGFVFASN